VQILGFIQIAMNKASIRNKSTV